MAPDLKFEEDGLTREISVRQQVFTTLTQIYEQARLEEVRDTPVLMVVEPAVQAPKADSRKLLLKVLVALFVGLGISIISVLFAKALGVSSNPDPEGRFKEVKEQAVADLRRLRLASRKTGR